MPNSGTPMQLLVASDATRADLHILGNVTKGARFWGMTFKDESDTDSIDVARALADLPDTCSEVCVHINSMGGEVAEGVAIYNALKSHRAHVTTVCEGFACSIASVIFMAGDTRVMRNASLLMIHEAWLAAQGSAKDLRKAADDLETITELSKRAYMEHATGELTREMLDQLMADETWILPEQAVEWGLATEAEVPEEAEEPEQSAMISLMRRLSEPMAELVVADAQPVELSDECVRQVAEAVAAALAERGAQAAPAPAQPGKHKSFMQRAALMFADQPNG